MCVLSVLNGLPVGDKPQAWSLILFKVMVCCDWLDLGQVPLLWPGGRSVSRSQIRALSSLWGHLQWYILLISRLQGQAGNVFLPVVGCRNHSNVVLFTLPGLVFFSVEEKKKVTSSKIQCAYSSERNTRLWLGWALAPGCLAPLKDRGCLKCLETALPFPCSSPICWLQIAVPNSSGHHENQQMNVPNHFNILKSKAISPNSAFLCILSCVIPNQTVPVLTLRNLRCSPRLLFLLLLLFSFKYTMYSGNVHIPNIV